MSESITDIVREMRERFKPYAKSESNDARYTAYMGYAEFADRIEAAHNHEVVVSKNATTTQESLAVGNNANMREALAAYLALWDNGTMNNLDELKRVIKQMREALAAPPRNCDKCKNADKAVALAIDAEVVDCNFGAREMAEFLLAEAEGGAE